MHADIKAFNDELEDVDRMEDELPDIWNLAGPFGPDREFGDRLRRSA